MAVKTITIDMEAYEILVRARRGNESFSKVIKHTLAGAGNTAAALLHHLNGYTVSDRTLDAVDRVIAERDHDLIVAESTGPYGS